MVEYLSKRENNKDKNKESSGMGTFLDNVATNSDRKAILLCELTLQESTAIKFACAHFDFAEIDGLLKNFAYLDKYTVLSEYKYFFKSI